MSKTIVRTSVKSGHMYFRHSKYIEFVFEDCDRVEIPMEFIYVVYVSDLYDTKTCEYIYIGFDSSIKDFRYNSFGNPEWDTSLIERIKKRNDIKSINIAYTDREDFEIVIPYYGNCMGENEHQELIDYGEYGYLLMIDKDRYKDNGDK